MSYAASDSVVACSMQHAVCSMQYAACSMHDAACSMQHAVCTMQYVLCSMQHAACSMQYARCSMHDAVCTMQYVLCSMYYVASAPVSRTNPVRTPRSPRANPTLTPRELSAVGHFMKKGQTPSINDLFQPTLGPEWNQAHLTLPFWDHSLGTLLLYITFRFLFLVIGITLPVPCGVFAPCLAIGAGIGR